VARTTCLAQFYIRLSLILLLALFLNSSKTLPSAAQESGSQSDPAVEAIFNALTPPERVGQLFMVSFNGNQAGPNAEIAELIQIYRIGGVVLSAKNRNFTNDRNTPNQVLNLTNALQALAQAPAVGSQGVGVTPTPTLTLTLTPTVETYTPLPLFIAVEHEGNGFPYTQIRNGLIDIPNPMALGATWNPDNARLVGEVVGRELSLVGINLLFGPSLDVLDNPRPERGGSLGARTFGGHPFWVGQMGQAYIRGVHQGSQHQVLTIARHFPGFGSSDREIDQGVPTILKSLDDLRQTELPPFFKVTRIDPTNPDSAGLADGLMAAHIRYQGLQGNVSISLDARNLPAILALKEFAPWREAGGLIVSAPLGAPAALQGITATGDNFPARRLAQDALLAGSDVLLLTNFTFADKPGDELVNIKNAIEFFRERYANDPNFKAAVDKAVRRIIQAKIKIYGRDVLKAETRKPAADLALLNEITLDLDQIAQAGVTLITPPTQGKTNPLPGPPQPGDKILIFTDDRLARDCAACPEFPLIETTALQDTILQLFGPQATGQISPEQITSLSFTDLKTLLSEQPPPESAKTDALIQSANWIIFAMLDIDSKNQPQSDAVRVLLRNRYDTLRNKNLVVFAFDAPYFLDETEISQLTAYYGFYSKSRDYVKAAARLLFQQFEPSGASPVGIPALGPLDLNPDPKQLIQIEPVRRIGKDGNTYELEKQAEPITKLDLAVGESILFQTSVIVDKNGHPVPDGAPVDFFGFYPLEGLSLAPSRTTTTNGVAQITIVKERDTPLLVSASSDLATSITFNIGPGIIDTPTPTITPTAVPSDTPSPPSPTPTLEKETPTPVVTPEPPAPPPSPPRLNLIDLAYALVGMILVGGIAFTLGGDRFSLEERVRPALMAVAIGLVGYVSYAILAVAYPAASIVGRNAGGHWVAPLISLLFAILGMVAWFLKPGRIFWVKDVERLQGRLKELVENDLPALRERWRARLETSKLAAYFADRGWLARLKTIVSNTGRKSQNNSQNEERGDESQ